MVRSCVLVHAFIGWLLVGCVQMPDVSELLHNVTALLDGNIKEEVAAGQQVFRDISAGVRRSVQQHIPSVQAALADTGNLLLPTFLAYSFHY